MPDAIAEAIAAAKAQASATPPAQTETNVVAYKPPVGAPVTVLKAGDMMAGSFSVDAFMKVSEDGMKIGDKAGLITDPFQAVIDLNDVFYYFAVKYGNNPAVYEKTTNRASSLSGKPWGDVLRTASQVDGPKFKGEYRSADVPVVLLQDVRDIKGTVVAETGMRIGKSLSTTEWREFEQLLRSAAKSGINADNGQITVEIGFKARKNASNTWGVLTFTLVGEVAEAVA
jgi:hypothetical protein